jgi:2-methylisocitrate lyase-like PEP mutase family enzyme
MEGARPGRVDRKNKMSLKQSLLDGRLVVAPGVYDALTASLAAEAGFEALYLSGAAIAYTRLGRPDIGLVSMSEVAEVIALVRDRVPTPMVVDADNGYGNALNVQRTVRMFERAGATAIQLEDQSYPKRCGHLQDKSLISAAEMAGKVKAAVDARTSEETLIVARTDAIAVEGFERAVERARLYAEAGADVLFVEAPKSREQLAAVTAELGTVRPLLANMVEGGDTPLASAAELGAIGFRLVIFPGGIARALARTAQDYYRSLAANGSNQPFQDRMFDFKALNALIGTSGMLARGQEYERFGAELKDGDTLPLRLQPDHRRGARRLPWPLSRRDRRHTGAGYQGPADLRRCHVLRGEVGDREGRARGRAAARRHLPVQRSL